MAIKKSKAIRKLAYIIASLYYIGVAICIALLAGVFLLLGFILITYNAFMNSAVKAGIVAMNSSMTMGVALVAIGSVLMIGSFLICIYFRIVLKPKRRSASQSEV